MKAEIIAIGSELTCGARLDTNSQWLSQELEGRGWTVHRHTTIADDHDGMVRVFQEAAARSRLVLITGGLGPTLDDITRDTLADAFNQPLVPDHDSLAHIEAMFSSRGRTMPDRNKVQALRPANASAIHNAHGTAPGILMHLKDPECTIAVMPGVPAEMKLMFHEQITDKLPQSSRIVHRSLIRTFGYGESDAERLLGELTARGRNPEVGITASQAVISLSITSRADSKDECDRLTANVRQTIYDRLGTAVYADGDLELYDVVAQQLLERRIRLALLEGPTTGGLISQWFTEREDYAACLSSSRMFPTPESIGPEVTASGDAWRNQLRAQADEIMQKQEADFVVLSSPSHVVDDGRVRRQNGSVVVVGRNLDEDYDVSMTGNLSIFRNRAARHALNILRLHLHENG